MIGIVLLILWMISISAYSSLPERIPVHFGWDGTPDRWADKSVIHFFMLPGIATMLAAFMMILSRYPHVYNFPQKEEVKQWPPEYRKPVYSMLNRMMYWIGLAISVMFLFIQVQVIKGAKTQSLAPANLWPMWILVAGIVLLPIYYLIQLSRRVKELRERLAQSK